MLKRRITFNQPSIIPDNKKWINQKIISKLSFLSKIHWRKCEEKRKLISKWRSKEWLCFKFSFHDKKRIKKYISSIYRWIINFSLPSCPQVNCFPRFTHAPCVIRRYLEVLWHIWSVRRKRSSDCREIGKFSEVQYISSYQLIPFFLFLLWKIRKWKELFFSVD